MLRFMSVVLVCACLGCSGQGEKEGEGKPRSGKTKGVAKEKDSEAFLAWLHEISVPLMAVSNNDLATDKVWKSIKQKLAELEGRKISWEVTVASINQDGLEIDDLPITRGSTNLEIFSANSENHRSIVSADKDFLESLRAEQKILVEGTIAAIKVHRDSDNSLRTFEAHLHVAALRNAGR